MVNEFLSWCISLFKTMLAWLGTAAVAPGISLLAIFAGVFVIGLLIDALVYKGG